MFLSLCTREGLDFWRKCYVYYSYGYTARVGRSKLCSRFFSLPDYSTSYITWWIWNISSSRWTTLSVTINSEISAAWEGGQWRRQGWGLSVAVERNDTMPLRGITMFRFVIQWSPDRGHGRDPEDRKAPRRLKTRRNELTVSRSVSWPRSSMGFRPYASWNWFGCSFCSSA